MLRFFLDECIPPIIRDSRWFMYPFYYVGYRGKLLKRAMDFKRDVGQMSPAEYTDFYASIHSISRNRPTDLNKPCFNAIVKRVTAYGAGNLLDVGCGESGHLLESLAQQTPRLYKVGTDIVPAQTSSAFSFCKSSVQALPFADKTFDIVIASHVLEHCQNLEQCVNELKRVCRDLLIVVVPKQRPYYYTIDEHIHFFFYKELLTDVLGLAQFECCNLGGDWFYCGRVEPE